LWKILACGLLPSFASTGNRTAFFCHEIIELLIVSFAAFWGRLGMQDNKPTTVHVTKVSDFNELMYSGKYNVSSWDLLNDEVIQVGYRLKEGFIEPNSTTNVVLAA
jgi:hypothetical protein